MNDRGCEIVCVRPKDLKCPSCGSNHVREDSRFNAPAPLFWRLLRPRSAAMRCSICHRTDTHWHLCCAECGRVWDIG